MVSNRVAHDSLCAVPARMRLPTICTIMRRTLQLVPCPGPYGLRWLPVHVRDMVQLAQQNPEMHAKFMKGNFVVQNHSAKVS